MTDCIILVKSVSSPAVWSLWCCSSWGKLGYAHTSFGRQRMWQGFLCLCKFLWSQPAVIATWLLYCFWQCLGTQIALQTDPIKFGLFWKNSFWGQCLIYLLTPRRTLPVVSFPVSLQQTHPAYNLTCIFSEYQFHPSCHSLHLDCFWVSLGLNFFILCWK